MRSRRRCAAARRFGCRTAWAAPLPAGRSRPASSTTGACERRNAMSDERLVLETTKGNVVVGLRPDLAPNHVARITELVRQGFYDGVVFHRVIDGFIARELGLELLARSDRHRHRRLGPEAQGRVLAR